MSAPNPIKLLGVFKPLANKNRYTLVTGGRGSGKSFHIACFVVLLTYKPNQVILFTRYTLVSAFASIIPEFIDKLERWGIAGNFRVTKTAIINKATGSRIIFSGIKTSAGNQTAKLKSIAGLTCWVLEEAEEMVNEEEFNKIDESIRTEGAQNRVFLVLNPSHQEHWIYKRFFQNGALDYVTYIHTTYKDNARNLSESFLGIAERTKQENPKAYASRYLGEWGTLADAVFDNYELYEEEPSEYDYRIFGGDFGFVNDPATIVQVIRNGRKLYLKEMLYKPGLTNFDLCLHINGLGIADEPIVWDSAEQKSITELRFGVEHEGQHYSTNAIPAIKGADSVHYGLQAMQGFQLYLHKGSKNLVREFAGYAWKKGGNGEYMRNAKGHRIPNKGGDHLIDAARYAITRYFG